MNSGIGNLIGSVSYELASDEACRTKAQHEARPSPSKPSAPHKQPRQAQRKARPSRPWQRAQRAQELRGLVARVGLAAWAAARTHAHGRPIVAAVCVCVSVCVHARFLKHAEFG